MKKFFKNIKGFTGFEFLMAIGVTAVFTVAVLGIYAGMRTFDLEDTPFKLIQHIRLTQNNSMISLNGSQHGIHFEANRYVLYQGDSYDGRDVEYDQIFGVPDNVVLCWSLYNQESESSSEINFSRLGVPDSIGIIVATNIAENLSKVIRINQLGMVAYDANLTDYCACSEAGALSCEDIEICHSPVIDANSSDLFGILGATIYVEDGIIVGGPDDGEPYEGVLNGTNQDDIIVGTYQADIIYGNNGDDILYGSEGDNMLYGGNGKDIMYSKTGNDLIEDSNATGTVIVTGGNNIINLSDGNAKDFVQSGPGDDNIRGGNSKDTIIDLGGNNEIDGGHGMDIICTGHGDDIIDGSHGSDKINANGGTDTIIGGQANDDVCLNGENISTCEDTETNIPECEGLEYYAGGEVPICHYPHENRYITETLYVLESEIPYHLMHGDLLGSCGDDIATRTIQVNALNIFPHLVHGDTIGACDGDPGEGEITICHGGQTINILESAWSTHEAHGDTLGACAPQEVCGNGLIIAPEQCDDGNVVSGDGCGTDCFAELGYVCEGEPSICTSQICASCDGKVSKLTLKYNGSGNQVNIKVKQKKGDIVFDDLIDSGEKFFFVGTENGTMSPDITILENDVETTTIHTSCSQAIGPGLVVGDFEVVNGESKNNGLLCGI